MTRWRVQEVTTGRVPKPRPALVRIQPAKVLLALLSRRSVEMLNGFFHYQMYLRFTANCIAFVVSPNFPIPLEPEPSTALDAYVSISRRSIARRDEIFVFVFVHHAVR